MRYGIFSDIHGNLEAFKAAIDALSHERIDRYLCVGDIVGYGANPNECIKKTKDLNAVTICGNHDRACVELTDIRYFNDAARQAVIWTKRNLSEENSIFLKGLELLYKNEHLTMVHGTLQEPEMFHYMFDSYEAYATFNRMQTPICFVGHSHVPGIFLNKNNDLKYFYKEKFELFSNEKAIVNIGSIGQPRDGDPELCYCIYDVDRNMIELKRLSYDVEKAQRKILEAGLPVFLAYRLSEGM